MADMVITSPEEEKLKKELEGKNDVYSMRLKRYLAMPDLSRTPDSPIAEVVKKAKGVFSLAGFDDIKIPEIIPINIMFDLFNMPEGHPARSKSDTYYVDEGNVLRTHDTVFWYYYLNHPEIKKRIENRETLGVICYGKVYRKDEVDSRHMNVFHQFGAWYIAPDSQKVGFEELKNAVGKVVSALFGLREYRFNDDNFPYT